MGKVTPFAGRTFKVRPALTVVGGAIVFRDSELRATLPELRSVTAGAPKAAKR